MNDDQETTRPDDCGPTVRKASDPAAIPVFNCPVLVSRLESKEYQARCATLAIEARAGSERQALQAVVGQFKYLVAACLHSGESIPWLDPPRQKTPEENERWIAVLFLVKQFEFTSRGAQETSHAQQTDTDDRGGLCGRL
jgi:hypothetical protein